MKVVVIGGTGLIGAKLVGKLKNLGHEAVAASPSKGVNTITGEGLAEVLKDADVVVDVANAPSFEDKAVLEFFETSGRNLVAAEKQAGVAHHVVLSVVGTDSHSESGYLRAKSAQEQLIKKSAIPYSIVRSTQFFEFLEGIADAATVGNRVRLSPALLQPIAAEDVADFLRRVALEPPLNGTIDIAGPERYKLAEIVERYLEAKKDPRTVIPDSEAPYFGARISDSTLIPSKNARLGSISFKSWFDSQKNRRNGDG